MKSAKIILSLLFGLLFSPDTMAQVRLPQIFRDSMVLQRNAPIKIWGWASNHEEITLTLKNHTRKTKASASGEWEVVFPKMKAGGPYNLQISATNNLTVHNILIGDVWLVAGQSNMEHQLFRHDVTYAKEIREANFPEIRHFKVPRNTELNGPKNNMDGGKWEVAVTKEIPNFSAVAYFFAKQVYDKYGIPIGLINASVGGTRIEAWTSENGFHNNPDILNTIERNKDSVYINSLIKRDKAAKDQTVETTMDLGISGPIHWYDPSYKPLNWRKINIPGYWEDQGIKDLNGTVWYRKEIKVPQSMAEAEAKLFLGRIVDADQVYLNGTKIGQTSYQYPQRQYSIPSNLLITGKNTLVVKVTNYNGKGGFVPDKPYFISSEKDTVGIKGYWEYKVGEVFAPKNTPNGTIFNAQNEPTALYNAMVAPYTQLALTGVLWYQGESNSGEPEKYAQLLQGLIIDWRNQFELPNLPFIYAQLPNFMDVNYLPEESKWAEFRHAQSNALQIANTAMTVNIDLGEWNDIHPENKKDVGERMALAAFKLAYNEDVVFSGPLYNGHTIENNKILLSFSYTGSGLITVDGGAPAQFAIAGEDKKFVWANAKIEDNKVIVWHNDISAPKYVRYAWSDNPDNANLYNKEGLPASPFTTE
ncbi:sialate O-acetylesterase [Maribacter sedimenticola]|uniref:Sialate O-acetylesterase n=1 Tax=Maribacter sedimenticola TaxID=228956 RepID=A0ABY1SJP5_9FLAO|nr:sialate O-acetylesterase [Maribacter sedimenticola]SNR64753.1 sialate O-acetylesterase [Maribacter sedimenticola]